MNTTDTKNVFLRDRIITTLLAREDNREYVCMLISKLLGIPVEKLRSTLELKSPRINVNANTQNSIVDALYETDEFIINFEANFVKNKRTDIKNSKYICHLLLNQFRINGRYSNIKPIIQINLNNYDAFNDGAFISISTMMNKKTHQEKRRLVIILDVNLDYLRKLNYAKLKEMERNSLEKLLYIYVCNEIEKLKELYKEEKLMQEELKKVSALTEDFANELYYNPDDIYNEYVFDEGKKLREQEIVKSMIQLNTPIDDIVKITGLSKKEIIALK